MDEVFKALADPTRRALLDVLHAEDGLTLGALESRFDMTRFGVMKHLRLLEDAGLVVSRRVGREKRHHLNAVPIRQIHDRWVGKFVEGWVAALTDLKRDLEGQAMEKVFEIYIRTTPERLWRAITDPDERMRFHFGNRIESTYEPGSAYTMTNAGAPDPLVQGENLEVDPPHRLVQSYHAVWDDDVAAAGTSRLTWEIEAVGDSCRLTVVHDQLPE
ncbi:MAG TPA: metalloregulator ArsR/SmtB family transcription factor, partial [Euzebya sp.]|nr:metalloregulator ArsR/SmtB family transcription factor [Euzebya sp.]